MTRHIVQFSGGAGSWAAAKRVAEWYETNEITLLFADTLIEDQDCYRFLLEGAANIFGVQPAIDLQQRALALPETYPHEAMLERKRQLTALRVDTADRFPFLAWIAEGRTPHEVFADERMLGNGRFDPCSKLLKRQFLDAWKRRNCDPADTICYVGIDWTEKRRYEGMVAQRPGGWQYEAPLCHAPWLTSTDVQQWMRREGITPPRLYALGFHHNNCGGGCIKAGQASWANLLRTFPDRYRWWEQHEKVMQVVTGKAVTILTDRRGDGKKKPLPLQMFRERVEQGDKVDEYDIGGCGCALPE